MATHQKITYAPPRSGCWRIKSPNKSNCGGSADSKQNNNIHPIQIVKCKPGNGFGQQECYNYECGHYCQINALAVSPSAGHWMKAPTHAAKLFINRDLACTRGCQETLDDISTTQTQAAMDALNHRPRKALNFRTPHEVIFNTQTTLTDSIVESTKQKSREIALLPLPFLLTVLFILLKFSFVKFTRA